MTEHFYGDGCDPPHEEDAIEIACSVTPLTEVVSGIRNHVVGAKDFDGQSWPDPIVRWKWKVQTERFVDPHSIVAGTHFNSGAWQPIEAAASALLRIQHDD